MGRKRKPTVTIGAKFTKKDMVSYHGEHDYAWWDSEEKVWLNKKLSDKITESVVIEEIKTSNNVDLITAKGKTLKVVWVEFGKKKTRSRPKVIPLSIVNVNH